MIFDDLVNISDLTETLDKAKKHYNWEHITSVVDLKIQIHTQDGLRQSYCGVCGRRFDKQELYLRLRVPAKWEDVILENPPTTVDVHCCTQAKECWDLVEVEIFKEAVKTGNLESL